MSFGSSCSCQPPSAPIYDPDKGRCVSCRWWDDPLCDHSAMNDWDRDDAACGLMGNWDTTKSTEMHVGPRFGCVHWRGKESPVIKEVFPGEKRGGSYSIDLKAFVAFLEKKRLLEQGAC